MVNDSLILIGLSLSDAQLLLECIECRLHLMDQENQWFLEEPAEPYYQLVELAEFISGFTNSGNRVQSSSQPGEV